MVRWGLKANAAPYPATAPSCRSRWPRRWSRMTRNAQEVLETGTTMEKAQVIAEKIVEKIVIKEVIKAHREKLPERRKGYTQKAIVGGHKGLPAGPANYRDRDAGRDLHRHAQGRRRLPGDEMNNFAIAVSVGLQYGVPLEGIRGRPSPSPSSNLRGWCRATTRSRNATSILDYIFRELAVSLPRPDGFWPMFAPTGQTFDDIGRGAGEGRVERPRSCPESRGSSPIDVLKQVASTGYLRKRAPQELVVFQGWGRSGRHAGNAGARTRGGGSTTVAAIAATTAVTTGTVKPRRTDQGPRCRATRAKPAGNAATTRWSATGPA